MVDIYKAIINGIDYYIERIEYRLDQIAIINAFVCGINNGVGDFVAGLFDLCALLVTIIDKVERDSITEKLENLYEDFKKHPLDKIQKTLVDAFNDLIERYTNKSEFENAYHKGEDLVSLFILVDGVLEVVKVLKGIPKGFEELAAWAERSAKRLGGVVKSVEELTEFVIKNGIQIDKKGLEFVIVMVKGDRGLIESILLSTKEVIEGKTIEELVAFFKIIDPPKVGSLSNYQARIWYTLKKQKIGALIERESSLLAKAKKAFNLRNEFRAATRNFMKDKKLAGYLESVEKNMKWEEIMERTLKKEKINSIEDAYNYIITTSKKGRDGVDKLFKID